MPPRLKPVNNMNFMAQLKLRPFKTFSVLRSLTGHEAGEFEEFSGGADVAGFGACDFLLDGRERGHGVRG